MNTVTEKIVQLKRKHEKELADLYTEDRISHHLPGSEDNWRVHMHELHGTIAGVSRTTDNYSVARRGSEPATTEDLRRCLEILEPVPLAKVDVRGSTSFVSMWVPNFTPEKYEIEQQVAPVLIKADPGTSRNEVHLTWVAQLGNDRVRVSYQLPWDRWIQSNWTRKEYRGGVRYEQPQCLPGCTLRLPNFPTPHVVNWASGSYQFPGTSTLYWDAGAFEIEDLLRAFEDVLPARMNP